MFYVSSIVFYDENSALLSSFVIVYASGSCLRKTSQYWLSICIEYRHGDSDEEYHGLDHTLESHYHAYYSPADY